jgi:hypothetical protein
MKPDKKSKALRGAINNRQSINKINKQLRALDEALASAFSRIVEELEKQKTVLALVAKLSFVDELSQEEVAAVQEFLGEVTGSEKSPQSDVREAGGAAGENADGSAGGVSISADVESANADRMEEVNDSGLGPNISPGV